MGMAGMGMGGGSESAGTFWKSEEKRVMIRAFDFTVEPDESYRYRVRIVVANPNFNREDVSAAAKDDVKKKYLEGPWSKETDVVTMPPDVAPYVVRTFPPNPSVKPKVYFQVIRFNPDDGWTVPRTFDAGVGDIIGDVRNEEVPRSDGSGVHREPIDFNTRQIVLDIEGGETLKVPDALGNVAFERPAYAILLRSDGAMVVHNQADDLTNEVRRDTEANYKHEKEQSGKKRQVGGSQAAGYSSMMQMMGGGYGGMMRGGGMR
jgi:hypothetical protein